jgi:UDP-2,3-diacylglucosamine pyrophosphatase LpxH
MSKTKTYARTLFLSDIHLGYKPTRIRELLDFLHTIDAERIVLVGDIVDGLSLAKRFFGATSTRRFCVGCLPDAALARV